MFKTSHLQELKRRYASMYAQPVEKEVIEDGTIEGVNQYKKDTPGQGEEVEEHCGVCGQGIGEGFQLQATMALDDEGIKSKWKKGKLYVAKRDIKKAEKALGKSFKKMKKGAEPDLYYEEVELDEGKFKKGDIVIPNMGPHKGDKHEIIHDFGDGSYNIKPLTHPRNIKYKLGASKAKENQLKLVKEEVELDVEITESTTTDKKNTFGMAPFKDLKNVADAALKIMTGQSQEVKEEEEKEEVTKEDQPQQLTEQIV